MKPLGGLENFGGEWGMELELLELEWGSDSDSALVVRVG